MGNEKVTEDQEGGTSSPKGSEGATDWRIADAYYRGFSHGKQTFLALVEAARNVYNLVTVDGSKAHEFPSYHSVSILGEQIKKLE